MLYEFLQKIGFTRFETWLAGFLGKTYRKYVLRNKELTGKVGKIYMTRGKIKGKSKNLIYAGYVNFNEVYKDAIDNDIVYEVVYQALLETKTKKYVLSLDYGQLWMIGNSITLLKYWLVIHLGHRFIIGADIEIYPSHVIENME